MTDAQRIARARYPQANRWPHDFTAAQGYAACYEELVVPLMQRVSGLEGERSEVPAQQDGTPETRGPVGETPNNKGE